MIKVPTFSSSQLENIAQQWLKKFGQYDNRLLRIEQSAEKGGFAIIPVPGMAEIAEAYLAANGLIFVDEGQYLNSTFRWKFTLAEEIAHDLIHRPMFDGLSGSAIQDAQESLTDSDYQLIERTAKELAGCILMPADTFRERFQHFWKTQEQFVSNDLGVMKYVIRQLQYDFGVSCHAISIRAKKLGLIDQEQLDDYLEYLSSRHTS